MTAQDLEQAQPDIKQPITTKVCSSICAKIGFVVRGAAAAFRLDDCFSMCGIGSGAFDSCSPSTLQLKLILACVFVVFAMLHFVIAHIMQTSKCIHAATNHFETDLACGLVIILLQSVS